MQQIVGKWLVCTWQCGVCRSLDKHPAGHAADHADNLHCCAGSWAWAGLRHTQVVCQVALLKRSLAIPPGLPHALEQLLSSCLAPSPASRPMFDEIVDVLNEWLQTTWRADPDAVTLRLPSHAAPAATP